jgi:SAM-dependent methyltransferase
MRLLATRSVTNGQTFGEHFASGWLVSDPGDMVDAVPKTHATSTPEQYERSRSGHFEEHRVALIHGALWRHHRPGRVLELGCGTGSVIGRLACSHRNVAFHGVDIENRLLDYARTNHGADNITWCSELPLSSMSGRVDAVYSIDVIHHLQDRPGIFASLHQLLVPGGTWLIIEPNIWHPVIWWQQEHMKRTGLDEDHFRPWVVEPELLSEGFDVHRRTYAHLWPAACRRLPHWALALEAKIERVRVVGGSVVYEVVAR